MWDVQFLYIKYDTVMDVFIFGFLLDSVQCPIWIMDNQ